jgi:hypothetical protein
MQVWILCPSLLLAAPERMNVECVWVGTGFEAFANCLKAHESDSEFKKLSDELKKIQKEATTVKKAAPEEED